MPLEATGVPTSQKLKSSGTKLTQICILAILCEYGPQKLRFFSGLLSSKMIICIWGREGEVSYEKSEKMKKAMNQDMPFLLASPQFILYVSIMIYNLQFPPKSKCVILQIDLIYE